MSSSLYSKYAPFFHSPDGAGDGRPTALQVVQDEGLTGKLSGKVFLITGTSSGLGVETARAIASTGATVFLTARDLPKAQETLKGILEPGRVELIHLDLGSLASVRAAAAEVLRRTATLNVLVCNAGIMGTPHTFTADGFESQFGTNHLGHFLLFNLLKSTLLSSSTPGHISRVVMVSSSAHRGGGIRFGNEDFKSGPEEYTPWAGYSQSKTANIYMANEIERRYGGKGLRAISLMPGSVFTPLLKHFGADVQEGFKANKPLLKLMMTSEQGAANSVWAAIGKEWEERPGTYLERMEAASLHPDPNDIGQLPFIPGYAAHAFDQEKEERLWVDSLKMVGIEETS